MRIPKLTNSMRSRLLLTLLAILLPLVTVILIGSFQSVQVVREQVVATNRNIVSLYMDSIEGALSSAFQSIRVLAVSDPDLITLITTEDESASYNAKYRLQRKLEEQLRVQRSIQGFFIRTKDARVNLEWYQDNVAYEDKKGIRDYVAGLITSSDALSEHALMWQVVRVSGRNHLLRLFTYGEYVSGACVSLDSLVKPLTELNLGENGFVLFTDRDGAPLTNEARYLEEGFPARSGDATGWISGSRERYLAVEAISKSSLIHLLVLMPEMEILGGFRILIRVLLILAAASLVLIPLSLFLINRIFLKPLRDLTVAMKQIGAGNLGYRLDLHPHFDELELVNHTFNQMTDEINALKISVYDEQIQKQKAELQYTQLQIRPHFLFNSLSVLYSLAQLKKIDLVKELTMCLVSHFRYILRDGLELVRLADEMEHIRNYLRIQALRLPETLEVSTSIEEGLDDFRIPPLLIHTLLENSIKHAVVVGQILHVRLEITRLEKEGRSWIRIQLTDTGRGFSDAALQRLNVLDEHIDFQSRHIGLQNIRYRVLRLYGGDARLRFFNADGRACNEVLLPIRDMQAKGDAT